MLRVNNVSFESNSTTKITRKEPKVSPYQSPTIGHNSLPAGFNMTAKSLISFAGLQYYETLNENYFKLPEGCKPDKYQKDAASALYAGKDVLVTAPTGTGKTAIALYAITKNSGAEPGTNKYNKQLTNVIDKNMQDGGRTFYTTPLKALCNQKYRELQTIYGKENVGLLTGDYKDPKAAKKPIIVMTTEIYRNMVMGDKFKDHSPQLDNLKTVVFDELHYLGDADRGGVWEQSIILSDPKTQLLSLSATIGNAKDINDWMSKVKGKPQVHIDVPPSERHVPLEFQNDRVVAKTGGHGNKTGSKNKADNSPDPNAAPDKKSYMQMVDRLNKRDRLPAIFFVFSKKASKDLLKSFADDGTSLTTAKETKQIQDTVDRYTNAGKYLGESLNMEALEKGYAIHNSGLLPAQKELTEELFQKKLIKVIIATETLAAGINMPARTTVISSMVKPTSSGSAGLLSNGTKNPTAAEGKGYKRELSPNEFHQMAGRAGRRGMDKIGYVFTMSTSTEQLKKFETIVKAEPNELISSFKPDFSFVASYYNKTQDDDVINELMKKSLHAFDRSPVKSKEKSQEMMKVFQKQKDVLNTFGFVKKDNTLTEKGELLALLNGYHQIPVIDAIHSKRLDGLNPIELAACVGSLANINEKVDPNKISKFKKEPEFFEHEDEELKSFVSDFDEALELYNKTRAGEYIINDKGEKVKTFTPIEQNKDVAKHLYAWAISNSDADSVPRENWKELYSGDLKKSIRDEGSLFKEITQTVDLLKQMSTISEAAAKNARTDDDQDYYENLQSIIETSIGLLRKEPIVEAEEIK